jgi:hypothetical protein
MSRLAIVTLSAFLFAACATSRPATTAESIDPATDAPVDLTADPSADPTIVGAIDEAALEGSIAAEKGARIGRRVGIVAGLVAAVVGGPSHESLDDAIDRYRDTRDIAEATGAAIGLARGATEGAKRGYELDLQFAELHAIEGVAVVRPYPDLIEARFAFDEATLDRIALVFANREARRIDIEAAGDTATQVRDALLARGVIAVLHTHRNDEIEGVLMGVQYP